MQYKNADAAINETELSFAASIHSYYYCEDWMLLQGEMCQSIDKATRLIMKNMSIVTMALNIPVSCI